MDMPVNKTALERINTSLKIANILNTLQSWSDLTDLQSSIMMFCLLKAQQGQNICTLDELKFYIPERLYQRNNKRLYEVATSMLDEVAQKPLKLQVADDNYIVIDHIPSLFEKYRTFQNSKGGLERIEFSFNRFAMPFIQELRSNYTLLELRDYFALKGRQTKRLYTLLRQFRTTGEWVVRIDQFKALMGCNSYSFAMINKRVLEPALSQLTSTNVALKNRIIEQHAKAGSPFTEDEILTKEKEGLFCLFFNLKHEFIKRPHSKQIEKIKFTFEPQDPFLNHEQNYIRYMQQARQPKALVDSKGRPQAQTQSESIVLKQLREAQEHIKQLKELIAKSQTTTSQTPVAQLGNGQQITNTLQQENPTVHCYGSQYKAEQQEFSAQGVSSFEQSQQEFLSPQQEAFARKTDKLQKELMTQDTQLPVQPSSLPTVSKTPLDNQQKAESTQQSQKNTSPSQPQLYLDKEEDWMGFEPTEENEPHVMEETPDWVEDWLSFMSDDED